MRSGGNPIDIRDLNHVALNVADLESSVSFYGDVLGLRPLARPNFSFAGAWFALGERSQLHLIAGDGQVGGEAPRGTHFALEVADMEAVSTLLSAGNITHEAITRPDGAEQIFIRDPDGHCIEFTSLPPD